VLRTTKGVTAMILSDKLQAGLSSIYQRALLSAKLQFQFDAAAALAAAPLWLPLLCVLLWSLFGSLGSAFRRISVPSPLSFILQRFYLFRFVYRLFRSVLRRTLRRRRSSLFASAGSPRQSFSSCSLARDLSLCGAVETSFPSGCAR